MIKEIIKEEVEKVLEPRKVLRIIETVGVGATVESVCGKIYVIIFKFERSC